MHSSDDSCGHYAWRKKDHAHFPTTRILTKDELFHRMCNIAHTCIYVYLQKERGCHHGTCHLRQHYMDELVPGIHERMVYQDRYCTAIIASRMPLSLSDEMQGYYPLSLPMLEPPAVEDYLTTIGMHDAVLRQRVYEITHGHPFCVSILGTLWQEQSDSPFTLADLPQLQ